MIFPGFIGPSYTLASKAAEVQEAINLYPEIVETQAGKNSLVLQLSPGLSELADVQDGPVRGFASLDGNEVYFVAGSKLYRLHSDFSTAELGGVGSGAAPVSMAHNGKEVAIATGSALYVYSGGILHHIAIAPISKVWFCDGYFVALETGTQKFRLSGLYDGLSWDGLDFGSAEAFPDKAWGMLVDHREVWVFGTEGSQVFYNDGNPDFPFRAVPGGEIEQGVSAPDSPAKIDNSVLWLGGSKQGQGIVWRASPYTPTRVSTHAVEQAISRYSAIEDAYGYGYAEDGHSFYQLTFPTAKATWVLDVGTGFWHKRHYWDKAHGTYEAHRGMSHVHAFGKHLVGDRENGKIYEQSTSLYSDNGDEIRRLRRCPHLSTEQTQNVYDRLEVDMEVGQGLVSGQGSDPQMAMRFSNDGGNTWSNEYMRSMGKIGQYTARAVWNKLGRARDRVFEVWCSEPIKQCWVGAYLKMRQGYV